MLLLFEGELRSMAYDDELEHLPVERPFSPLEAAAFQDWLERQRRGQFENHDEASKYLFMLLDQIADSQYDSPYDGQTVPLPYFPGLDRGRVSNQQQYIEDWLNQRQPAPQSNRPNYNRGPRSEPRSRQGFNRDGGSWGTPQQVQRRHAQAREAINRRMTDYYRSRGNSRSSGRFSGGGGGRGWL